MNIKKGDTIGDIDSGGGYFNLEFAMEVVENGTVYTVDTNQKSLDYIAEKSREQDLNNIVMVHADEKGFSLPENGVDLLFFRSVFHHCLNK